MLLKEKEKNNINFGIKISDFGLSCVKVHSNDGAQISPLWTAPGKNIDNYFIMYLLFCRNSVTGERLLQ